MYFEGTKDISQRQKQAGYYVAWRWNSISHLGIVGWVGNYLLNKKINQLYVQTCKLYFNSRAKIAST